MNCYQKAFSNIIDNLAIHPGVYAGYPSPFEKGRLSVEAVAGNVIIDLQQAGYDNYQDSKTPPYFHCSWNPGDFHDAPYRRLAVLRCVKNPGKPYDFHFMYSYDNGQTWYGNYFSPNCGTPVDPDDDQQWGNCDSPRVYFAIK